MHCAPEDKRTLYREQGWWGDKTLADLFFANADAHGDRVALVDAPNRSDFSFGGQQRLTYTQLRSEVERLAGALIDGGIGHGDVIMIQLPNISEFVSLYFAAATIGAAVSPVAVQYRSHELAGMMRLVKPAAFICGTRFRGSDHVATASGLLNSNCRLMTFGPDPVDNALDLTTAAGNPQALADHRVLHPAGADDIFTICWTSGTTGAPKGVPRSHNHWVGIAPATYQVGQLEAGDVLLNPFPLINMASIGGITMSWLRLAGTMVLHHPFDPQVYLRQIAEERPHFTIAPPAILNMLLQNEALLAQTDLSSLRSIASGSAPLSPAMVKGFQDRFGINVVNVFGSNEGMSLATGPDIVPDPVERASYFPREMPLVPYFGGEPRAILQTRLVPAGGDSEICTEGVAGELQIKGPTVFEGYFEAPDRTAEAFTRDGYFRTGDLFEIGGEGRFYRFVGRCKDLIIRGGMNIAPEEIDQLLGGHPDLTEACAFSLPDPVMGERIGLAYVPREDREVGLPEISEFLQQQGLAKFKYPERLFRFAELPRNVTNKVMRDQVRERAMALQEGQA
ncbi:class I adenylate-forming enzyme family protein [Altererythrobacter aquiaggeris]|uniref:class I adenylate-forming enzyme family protein n=1 Tax=Aestuarierythrobacter aquiaggeris TaxID=1898396 RepID=UPI00301AADD7